MSVEITAQKLPSASVPPLQPGRGRGGAVFSFRNTIWNINVAILRLGTPATTVWLTRAQHIEMNYGWKWSKNFKNKYFWALTLQQWQCGLVAGLDNILPTIKTLLTYNNGPWHFLCLVIILFRTFQPLKWTFPLHFVARCSEDEKTKLSFMSAASHGPVCGPCPSSPSRYMGGGH